MSTGLRALKLALLGRLGVPRLSSSMKPALLRGLVDLHLAELRPARALSPGNHGLFQINGLMALVWQFPGIRGAEAAPPMR